MESTITIQQFEDKETYIRVHYEILVSGEKIRRSINVDPFDLETTKASEVIDMVIAVDDDDAVNQELARVKENKVGRYFPDSDGNILPIGGVDVKRWRPGMVVSAGELILYDGRLKEVMISHTTQSDWTPNVALNLFANAQIINPDSPQLWVQPDGAGGPNLPYPLEAIVAHNGSTWISDVADNVWEPGVSQWTEVDSNGNPLPEPEGGGGSEWAAGVSYAVADEVTYSGTTYSCLQAHTSQVGWEPPSVPSLWSAI